MEIYTEEQYSKSFYNKIDAFIRNNFYNIGKLNDQQFHNAIAQTFGSTQYTNYFEKLGRVTKLDYQTIELILQSSVMIAFDIYKDDIETIEKHNGLPQTKAAGDAVTIRLS
jgi:hypothetical protein